MSTSIFGWIQRVFQEATVESLKWTPLAHDKSVRFMEMSAL